MDTILRQMRKKMVLDALKDKFWHIRELALDKVNSLTGEDLETAKGIVKSMLEMDPKSTRSCKKQFQVIELLIDNEEERKEMYANAVMNDRSYDVVSEALAGLASIFSGLGNGRSEEVGK